jgi:uncharacterized repeat protein (TIGR01451 family)
MKLASFLRLFALLAFSVCSQIRAADNFFGLGVVPSTTTPTLNGTVGYTIRLTNFTGFALTDTHVISQFPTAFTVRSTTNNLAGANPPDPTATTVTSGLVDFRIAEFFPQQAYVFFVELDVKQTGLFTNSIIVTNLVRPLLTVTTNVIAGASTNVTGNADLSVAISGLPVAVLANDPITYSLTATNRGPSSASRVIVQNTVPTGTTVVSSSAASAVTKSGDVITWQVGTLTNTASQTLTLTIQTTNTADFGISANISAPSNTDASAGNDSVTNNISIQAISTNNLVLTRGVQKFNRGNGLFEETVSIQNVGTITIPTTRIMVTGLVAPDRLFNAGGTNGTIPYVLYTNALAPGVSSNVLVQLFFHDRKYNTSQTFTAVQGPLTNAAAGASISLTNIVLSTNGVISMEFPASVGRTYSVQQSEDVLFTNPLQTAPITPSTNRIIYTNVVTTNANRFFRAVLNP